jgi:hypothetical protein
MPTWSVASDEISGVPERSMAMLFRIFVYPELENPPAA